MSIHGTCTTCDHVGRVHKPWTAVVPSPCLVKDCTCRDFAPSVPCLHCQHDRDDHIAGRTEGACAVDGCSCRKWWPEEKLSQPPV